MRCRCRVRPRSAATRRCSGPGTRMLPERSHSARPTRSPCWCRSATPRPSRWWAPLRPQPPPHPDTDASSGRRRTRKRRVPRCRTRSTMPPMLVLIRDTAANPPTGVGPTGPGTGYGPFQPWPSSYQNPPWTTLSGPVHQTSMLSRNRDRALISLSGEAEPGPATSYRSQRTDVAMA
jgi:hypothetical protein